jgi:hypothetical protein
MLTDVVVSESISKTFMPGPAVSSITSMRDRINSLKSIFPDPASLCRFL